MNKSARYYALQRTKDELKIPITIGICSSDGPKFPFHESVKVQEYTIELACGGRVC